MWGTFHSYIEWKRKISLSLKRLVITQSTAWNDRERFQWTLCRSSHRIAHWEITNKILNKLTGALFCPLDLENCIKNVRRKNKFIRNQVIYDMFSVMRVPIIPVL